MKVNYIKMKVHGDILERGRELVVNSGIRTQEPRHPLEA